MYSYFARVVSSSFRMCMALSLVFFAASTAGAQSFYLGGSIGSAELSDSVFEGSNTIPAIYGGWNLSRYFGIELMYADFEEFSTAAIHEQSTKGFSIYGKAMLPIGEHLSIYGKIGQINWDTDITRTQDGFSVSDNDHDPAYGLGLEYKLTELLGLRLSYDVLQVDLEYSPIGPVFMDINGEVEFWSLGLHFVF